MASDERHPDLLRRGKGQRQDEAELQLRLDHGLHGALAQQLGHFCK